MSDYYAVQFCINILHPPVVLVLRKIEYRNLKAIDDVKLKEFISESTLCQLPFLGVDVDSATLEYDKMLTSILDELAPKRSKTIVHRPDKKLLHF